MGLKKGMSNNLAGRPAGTPNKVTAELKTWISDLINDNRDQFKIDLQSIDADKRLSMIEKLMQYVIPKQQTISVEAQIQAEYAELERLLNVMPAEAIEMITEKVLSLYINKNYKEDGND